MADAVHRIAEAVRAAGGRALVVGGWVRDRMLGHTSKDVDVEVYGVEPDALKRLLRKIGRVNAVGESFTVYKVGLRDGSEVDVSIPRRESKTGRGHRGFTVVGDPTMSIEEAARRRDFTVNAILFDPLTEEILDPFGGAADLRARVLRVVDRVTFVEDSLRVLRGAQFAARFDLLIEPATVELCRAIDLSDLPRERVWGEIEKLLLVAPRPSLGLAALRRLDVPRKLFPELDELDDAAWDDTALAADSARQRLDDQPATTRADRIAVMLAALARRLDVERAGTLFERLNIHSIGGVDVRRRALALVAKRETPAALRSANASDGDVRRLALAVDLRLLSVVTAADGDPATAAWLDARVRELGLEHGAPEPILLGRHLLELGVPPGPDVGRIARAVYDLQLNGTVVDLDGALAAARSLIADG